jgi:hypothetical protein
LTSCNNCRDSIQDAIDRDDAAPPTPGVPRLARIVVDEYASGYQNSPLGDVRRWGLTLERFVLK